MIKSEDLKNLLDAFDSLELDNMGVRRMSHKPLYDYFQKLLRFIGVKYCGLEDNSIKNTHLKVRWMHVKSCLEYVLDSMDDLNKWDALINQMQNIRSKCEHDDFYDPNRSNLQSVRNQIEEFTLWICEVSDNYYKKSTSFTFKEGFYHYLRLYIDNSELIIGEHCREIKEDVPADFSSYCSQLSEYQQRSKERLKDIRKIEDIELTDLNNLIQMVKIISRFDTREEVLVELGICPECGGKISETQEYIGGGTEENPEPTGIYYRVGCKKCGYLLHDEFIDI